MLRGRLERKLEIAKSAIAKARVDLEKTIREWFPSIPRTDLWKIVGRLQKTLHRIEQE